MAAVLPQDAISHEDPFLEEVQRLAFGGGEPLPLPRHRHDLPREQVETTQRARIVLATAEVVVAKSYPATTTRDVIKAAGVSSKTFYSCFEGKEDAFLAAYTMLDGTMLALAQAPIRLTQPRTDLRHHVGAWLEQLAAWPLLARLRFIEGRAAGPKADAHRAAIAREIVATFGRGLQEASRHDARIARPSDPVLALLYGGITDRVTQWVRDEGPERLGELAPAIVEAIERICFLDTPDYAEGE